jgi:hypothetical protein
MTEFHSRAGARGKLLKLNNFILIWMCQPRKQPDFAA